MPISRSGTIRTKSPGPRVPAIPRTPTMHASPTPRFMPPSHFAAAGGYSPRNNTLQPPIGEHFSPLSKSPNPTSSGNPSNWRTMSRMHTKSMGSPSGSESSLGSTMEDRVPHMSESSKRQSGSQNDFIELEAQLLPSLRDTIDRMTGAPSRTSTMYRNKSSGNGVGENAFERRDRKNGSARTEKQLRSPRDPPSFRHRAPSDELATPTQYPFSAKSTPTTENTSRLKTPTKSALKASSRSPLPKSSGANTPVSTPIQNESSPSMAGSSLRTMKSILTRKCSGTLKSPFTSNKASQDSQRNESYSSHAEYPKSLCPTSDAPPVKSLGADSSAVPPFQQNSSITTTSRGDKFQSNIPRPPRSWSKGRPRNNDDLDSDFERRFEVESRDKRKLTVANAEVEVSVSGESGESEVELESRHDFDTRGWQRISADRSAMTRDRSGGGDGGRAAPIGLGLSFGHTPSSPAPMSREGVHQRGSRFMKQDETRPVILPPEKNLRFSLPASGSAESTYSDQMNSYDTVPLSQNSGRSSRNSPGLGREHRHLPNSYSGGGYEIHLERQYEHHPASDDYYSNGTQRNRDSVDSASTYFRHSPPQSLASTSTHSGQGQEQDSADDGDETTSEREGYSVRRSRTMEEKENRRSASWGPSIRLSAPGSAESREKREHRARGMGDDAEPSGEGNQTRRSRSAGRRRQEEHRNEDSARVDRMFPPNLKELIRRRTSFGKIDAQETDNELVADGSTSSSRRGSPQPHPQSQVESNEPEHTSRPRRHDRRLSDRERYVEPNRRRLSARHSQLQDPSQEPQSQSEAASIAEGYRSAAARERMAFGIPLSESDEILPMRQGQVTHRKRQFPHSESDMSSINENMDAWRQDDEESGLDADSILRNIPAGLGREADRDRERKRRHAHNTTPRLSVVSPSLSGDSAYDEPQASWLHKANMDEPDSAGYMDKNRTKGNTTENQPSTYLQETDPSTPTPTSYSADLAPTRESVIQEIFETEESLLGLLHICMRHFILPLRRNNSRSWISGIPATISRLLDWYDDIVNLHEQVYEALCRARDEMTPSTDRVSESLRWWVLKIELYMPYLGRLKDVMGEIERVVRADGADNELAQFVRLQERNSECQGWSMEKLLMLPVERLASYQDLFARMLDLTPKTHQDYLSTLSLSRSTDMVVRVITEVKVREDEYALLKAFSSRMLGLPSSCGLATRERRLLHSGPLQLVISNLAGDLSGGNNLGPSSEAKRISRSSRLLDAIGGPNYDFGKPPSAISGSSLITGDSEKDGSSASTPAKASWFSRLPLRRRSRLKSTIAEDDGPRIEENFHDMVVDISPRTVDIHAFVFNDLVLLARQGRSIVGSEPSWILSEDLGVFRPLSIARIRRRNAQEGMILSLEAAVIDPEYLNDTSDFRTTSWRVVDLLIPPFPPPSLLDDLGVGATPNDHFQPWLLSLRQCCKTTLRKMTFVGPATEEGSSFLGSDRVLDTQLAVTSLTASGLPIPRSPSGNLPETFATPGEDNQRFGCDEREERGWWSLRYQQVFREFQRQDSLLFDDDEE